MGLIRDEMAKSAASLIREFGQSMTLRRVTGSSYSTVTGVNTLTTADLAVTAVLVAFNKEDIDGDSIVQGDRKAYIQVAGSSTPKTGDKLVGVDFDVTIVAIHKILRNNTDSIVCICQARS